MAVYTQVTPEILAPFLDDFGLGELVDLQGIAGGIENTNYFVTLAQDSQQTEYVLTLFEELSQDEMPYFVELTAYLAEQEVPVPAPLKDRHGIALKSLCHRPALLLPKFAGKQLPNPDAEACAQAGAALAKLHLAGKDFFMQRQAHRGVFWWRRESHRVADHLDDENAALLLEEVQAYDALRERLPNLPSGVIHGDLFHDNALFVDGRLNAIIDLYNACTDLWLYDLAIVANDWCLDADGLPDQQKIDALLQAYGAVRSFTVEEVEAWPVLLRTAAMRFWLSRLISQMGLGETGYDVEQVQKDPEQCRQILLWHRANPLVLTS